jgi:Predicted metal-dependent phosphoesterases (PHP family)
MPIDLHTHSTASDGTTAPAILVADAAAAGLTAVALTDHDTLAGIEEARNAAATVGITFVPGVELSVDHDGLKLHLLVYFLEPGAGPLQDRLAELRAGRDRRNRHILERLGELGYRISMQDVLRHARGESVGRPHIADALVAAGYFPDRRACFTHLLRDGGPAYVPRLRLTATDAIRLARASGAVPVVAHPYTVGTDAAGYAGLFTDLAAAGLGGIEALHSEHGPELRRSLAALAARLGVVATGGSDYHGAGKPGIALGTGKGDLVVPDDVLEHLRAEAARS